MKKAISIILCAAMLIAVLPVSGIFALGEELSDEFTAPENPGAVIGNTAAFYLDYWANFHIVSDPAQYDDAYWSDESYWIDDEELPSTEQFIIQDYYYDEERGYLWYSVEAVPGYTLPEKLQQKPYILHTDAEGSECSLLISEGGKNFVVDAVGNAVSSVTLPVYETAVLRCQSTLVGKISYQWQILIGGEWVDISGEDKANIPVTVGMLLSALDGNYTASVRCISSSGSKKVIGAAIPVTVAPYTGDSAQQSMAMIADDGAAAPMMLALDDYGISVAAEEQEAYVTVKYIFANGTEAANPYVAQVPLDEEWKATVEFPTVQGYLPYYEGVRQDSLDISQVITGDLTFTVVYQPTDVPYQIEVYFQNIDDDGYTFQSTETLTGLTGTTVPLKTVTYEGMYELLHETPAIAANGSTKIQVYYNRSYYLTRFELDGGHSVYSIYARYGSELASHVGTPIKPGYTFVGWDDISSGTGDGIADVMPNTVPAKEQSFKAIWKETPAAEVRIAFWGENPNDEGYSYIESQTLSVKPGTVLTYGDGGYICGLEEHTHGDGCTYQCGLTAHTHDQSCYTLNCDKEHTHSDDCYTCGEEGHTHSADCYPNVGNAASPSFAPNNPVNGQIYSRWVLFGTVRFIYINGTWYSYNGEDANGTIKSPTCGKTESTHTHTDTCLGCGKEEHSHSDYTGSCYTLTCTQTPHTHDSTCTSCLAHQHSASCRINEFGGYDSTKWTLVKSDTVTAAPDGTSVMNVYFDRTTFTMTFKERGSNGDTLAAITDKWGADIRIQFNDISEKNTFFWSKSQSGGSPWTSFMDVMPAENTTFYADPQSGSTTLNATYYGQKLDGSGYDVIYPISFKGSSSITVSEEEFVEIEGYTFNDSKSSDIGDSYNGAEFYYDRALFRLEFYNGTTLAREESMLYEEPFSKFSDYIPELPSEYEAGSRKFVGWYLNPECTGEKVDLSQMKMPAENMALYAKWEFVYHNVNIYKEKHDDGTFGDPVLPDGQQPDPVLHGSTVFETDFTLPIPENKPYSFVGWFYMDGANERMWDFEHSVVVKNTDIYAKWSAEVLVPYTVRFIVQNDDGTVTEIADSISSSALAGTTVTFSAKGGLELYQNYQAGYFPLTTSHSLTMDVTKEETGMFYDFVYAAKNKVPYTVRYVDENGNDLIDPKPVNDNTYAVVTERFVYIKDYTPDKYQKTLVIDGSEGTVNEIIFHYTKDSTQSVYNVTHYIQSADGQSYIEHASYGDVAAIGETLKVAPLELKGFTYGSALVNGAETELTDDTVNGTIVKEGLEVKLYYTRNKYPYKIQYLDKDTLKILKEPTIVTEGAYYGTAVTESSPPAIDDYKLSSVSSCIITVEENAEPTKNIVNVYYSEQTVRIDYEVVGPDGCGSVSPEYTDVKVLSGTGAASSAAANEGYLFEGWYSDKACTNLITTNTALNLTIPEDGEWKAATYYAKFIRKTGNLTIDRNGAADETQVFVYQVKNDATNEVIYVTVVGNGSTTIHDLPLGEYTVTEQNDWAWRYSGHTEKVNHQSTDGTTTVFDWAEATQQWLDGNSSLVRNQRGQSG